MERVKHYRGGVCEMEEWNEGGEIGIRFLSTITGLPKKSFNLRLF